MRISVTTGWALGWSLSMLVASACDGSQVAAGSADSAATDTTADSADSAPSEDTSADTTADTAPEEDTTPPPAPIGVEDPLTPVAPAARPLPSGETDGSGIIIKRSALAGRFLYGIGADPDGVLGSLGGGAAGITPIRAMVVLVPDETGIAGAFEIRVWDPDTGAAMPGDDGLIETYAYSDVDDDTVRVELAASTVASEIAIYGSCRLVQSGYELHAAPVYADGLMTWPVDEELTRAGQCQWVPRTVTGLHVHYLRHDRAGRDFKPRTMDPAAAFGFFLAGDEKAPVLARLPGIAADEPPQTHTYYLVDFPTAMVPAAEQTFEAWNDALEPIVGRRPFATAIATRDIIPWDPRFHTVIWDKTGSGGAVAPFTNDPETGEIYQSMVVMWFGQLGDLITTYRDFVGAHPDIGDALASDIGGGAPTARELPMFEGFDARAAIARMVRPVDVEPRVLTLRPFVARPLAPAVRDAVRRDWSDDELKSVIVVDFLLHELGHNLGLRHNFIGSADKHTLRATHTSTTTMDYVIGMLDPGSYDRDAMRYGYATGAESNDYLYCTDESTDLEPACIQWDFANPARYQVDTVTAWLAAYTPESAQADIDDGLQYLDPEINRARRFVNTDWERWDEPAVDSFTALLGQVDCQEACTTHPDLRSAVALYLLYTRFQVTAWWEPGYPDIWLDFPAFTQTQTALMIGAFYELVLRQGEPLELKTAIIGKLATSAVAGTRELLTSLHDHYGELAELTGDDAQVKSAVDSAFSKL